MLDDFARTGRNVDLVLVDGDHSADGVRRDVEDLLASPAVGHTTILMHDTSNPTVRNGIEAVDFARHDKVIHVELSWTLGYVFAEPHFASELWVGCVLVDATRPRRDGRSPFEDRYAPMQPLLEEAQRVLDGASDIDLLRERLAAAEAEAQAQLARGDAEHAMRVAAQARVATFERRLRWGLAVRGGVRRAAATARGSQPLSSIRRTARARARADR